MKDIIYEYETGPIDHWEGWVTIDEFSEYTKIKIKQNPCEFKSYLQYKMDFYTLLFHIRNIKHMDYRDNIIYVCFSQNNHNALHPPYDFFIYELCLAFKQDTNGSCHAFTFISPRRYVGIEDKFGLKRDYIPNDYEDFWECTNLTDEEKKKIYPE